MNPSEKGEPMAITDFTPEQILAALDETTRPRHVTSRYERGVAWANGAARRIMAGYTLEGSPEQILAIIDKALREWLADGPDYDSREYVSGCEDGQETIRNILDGDNGEVLDVLEDAADRITRIYRQAQA